jgi:DNA-binding MarR family transcriptional regulator
MRRSRARFTDLQGRYLAFIDAYTTLHGVPAAEADMQRFFRVTPPAVHRMVLALEQRGLLRRVAGQARSIRLLLPPVEIPKLARRETDGRGTS